MILTAVSLQLTLAKSSEYHNTTYLSSPKILDFDFSPKELIMGEKPLQIALQTNVVDDNGDIDSIEAIFLSPSQNQSKVAFMNSTNLFSGDARNGNYTTNMSLPQSSEPGIWRLNYLIVCDKEGDCRRLDGIGAETHGFPAKLLILKKTQNSSLMPQSNSSGMQESSEDPARHTIDLDPNELRGWANTEKRFTAQRKIIINNVFNRPALCGP
ncbi:MAG: hypothetical protein LUO89_06270 [Methanothrix sp.]|nr:hypothetical protein [Methanothrix sp.]